MTERDKVKQKVVKLLSKTRERGASEAEAVAAAEVTELMAQFDIAASELEIRSVGSVEKIIAKRRYGRRAIGAGCAYMVSQICDCMAWHKPNSQTFFGLPHDVEIAAHLFDTISNCALAELDIYRSSAEFEREAKRARVEEGTGARAVLGTFITGIEERLYARLKALPDEKVQTVQEAAAATGRSLVVVKADQVKHDFEALGIRGALCRRLHAARLRAHPAFSQAKLMETANAKGVDLNFDGPSI